MARKKISFNVKKTRNKTPTVKRPAISDLKVVGNEPEVGVCISDPASSKFSQALNWYNYFYESEDGKKWLLDYMSLNSNFTKQDISKISRVKADYIPRSVGTMSYLMQHRNWTFDSETMLRFESKIRKAMNSATPTPQESSKAPATIQDRTAAKARDFAIATLDEHIDMFYKDNDYQFSLYEMLTSESASSVACNMIRDRVNAMLAELNQEGYENLGKRKLAKYQKFYNGMIEDLDRFQHNKKAQAAPRKPRAVKVKPASKLTERVNYQKEYAPLKLVSVSPESIIGAESLWIFNTKYKQLTVLHSLNGGLSVKGTTVTNFDSNLSVTKRVRKPEVVTQSVLTAGKVALRKLMEQIKAKPSVAKGRLGSDTILLRVVKA